MAQIAKALELRTHSFREDWTADFDVNQTDTFELITITENTTVNPMLQFTMRDFEFVSMSSANLFGDTADLSDGEEKHSAPLPRPIRNRTRLGQELQAYGNPDVIKLPKINKRILIFQDYHLVKRML